MVEENKPFKEANEPLSVSSSGVIKGRKRITFQLASLTKGMFLLLIMALCFGLGVIVEHGNTSLNLSNTAGKRAPHGFAFGQVAQISSNYISVANLKTGKTVGFSIGQKTRMSENNKPINAAAIKKGDMVIVRFKQANNKAADAILVNPSLVNNQ